MQIKGGKRAKRELELAVRIVLTLSVPYAALVSTFEKIEATTKRLEILNLLTQFLLVVAKRDTATSIKDSNLLKVVYLCINRVS